MPKDFLKRECFPHYILQKYVKGYSPLNCTNPKMVALIYPYFLAAYGHYPNNDRIPLYFTHQLYVEVCLCKVVNYIDLPRHLGQGHGRLAGRQPGHPPLAHRSIVRERALVISPMLGPSTDEAMRSTQLRRVIQGVGEIAVAVRSILSDEVGQYLMSHQCSRSSSYASSSGDLYSATGIPSVASLKGLTGVLARDTMIGLAKDLLDTYRFL